MKTYETGIDNNFDGHCDICGRFVDEYGHHRAVLVNEDEEYKNKTSQLFKDLDLEVDNLTDEEFISKYIKGDPYNMYSNMTYRYWKYIRAYSDNNPDNPLSSTRINDFLRNDILPPNAKLTDMIENVFKMNEAIGQFVIKETCITYRGMAFNEGDNFVKMLDNAFDYIKSNNKPYKFDDNGFVSTSRNLEYAKSLTNAKNKNISVLFSFILLPGTKAMPLSYEWGTTKKIYEKEILLKALESYHIVSLKKGYENNKKTYRGIIICSKEDLE